MILQTLNTPLAPCASSVSYYMLAETAAMDDTIVATRPAFEKKASKVKNKYMRHHAQMFAEDLNPLGVTYLKKRELMSITPVLQSCKQACVIDKHFNNLPPATQPS